MTKFYLVGEVPVRMVFRDDGTTALEAFNRRTGRFEANSRYYSMIRRDDTGLVQAVSETEFSQAVSRLQALELA
ncbi:hypothetical protein [Deinococcus ruber]|uniref:Uncharacterized protein n=1 Tax=Deinococcus ruber TaxID=1848197 RepID=A0A918CL96_9DEIO|nr:hypothetical protein [Deinococcus ruber]GGR27279.1 hypothetical protein GCM10008957_43320 [Deinococcus ruber]